MDKERICICERALFYFCLGLSWLIIQKHRNIAQWGWALSHQKRVFPDELLCEKNKAFKTLLYTARVHRVQETK